MGRHRTAEERRRLGEQARALRAAGRSRHEIEGELGIGSELAKELLRGVPLPDSLRRPRAKDELRELAVRMRLAGRTYDDIAADLGVSKSSCSLWLRDLPHPEEPAPLSLPEPTAASPEEHADPRRDRARALRAEGKVLAEIGRQLGVSAKTVYYWTWGMPLPPRSRTGGDPAHMEKMRRRYWDGVLEGREAERCKVKSDAMASVGTLTAQQRELLAVVAYWCEGSKSKPYAKREQVTFINSDQGLVRLFLAYLDDRNFPLDNRRLSLSIHESADIAAAARWWSEVTGVPSVRFGPPSVKRHNPKTLRKNVGDDYVGCLVVRLVRCRELYQRIEGVWQGIMAGLPVTEPPGRAEQSRVV